MKTRTRVERARRPNIGRNHRQKRNEITTRLFDCTARTISGDMKHATMTCLPHIQQCIVKAAENPKKAAQKAKKAAEKAT